MLYFTARDCIVTRCGRADASLQLTIEGVKDGIEYPRFHRPFSQNASKVVWEMPCEDECRSAMMRALHDVQCHMKEQLGFYFCI